MKKCCVLLTLLLLCGCLPLQESAAKREEARMEVDPQAEQWCFHYEQMDASLRPAYASLYAGMSAFEAQIVLEGVQEEDVETLFRSVIEDHPRLFYIGSSYRYRLYADGSMVLEPTYVYDEEQSIDIQQQIDEDCETILAEIPAGSEEERAAGLYAYVIEHAEYARNDRDQQMDGFFLNGKSVCAGYARAYQYLMQKAGFRCTTISGELREGTLSAASQDRSHAWNLVWTDDDWFYVDATSGDVVQYGPHTCYQYFKMSSQEASQLYETTFSLPQTADPSQSYFRRHHFYLTGYEEAILQEAIDAMKERGDHVLELRSDPGQSEALREALVADDRIFRLLARNGIDVDTLGCAQMEALGSLELYY